MPFFLLKTLENRSNERIFTFLWHVDSFKRQAGLLEGLAARAELFSLGLSVRALLEATMASAQRGKEHAANTRHLIELERGVTAFDFMWSE
jgi:hypothetical protein